jgi:hypothetical protein
MTITRRYPVNTKQIGLRLPEDIWKKLQENADANSELPSEAARRLLRDILKVSPAPPPKNSKNTPAISSENSKKTPAISKEHPKEFSFFQGPHGSLICEACGQKFADKNAAGNHQDHYRPGSKYLDIKADAIPE